MLQIKLRRLKIFSYKSLHECPFANFVEAREISVKEQIAEQSFKTCACVVFGDSCLARRVTFGVSASAKNIALIFRQKIFYRVINFSLRGRRYDLCVKFMQTGYIVRDLQETSPNVKMKIRVADMRQNQRR